MGETGDSPWSPGRHGWHIECSVMAMTHLDERCYLHVRGQDLVFPHHENEIAQSEAATGERFANYWLHVRLLETAGEKMSSSLQNYFTVQNAIEQFGANSIRMFLLSTAYSQRQTYSEAALHEGVERWERLLRGYERAVEAANSPDAVSTRPDRDLRSTIDEASDAFLAAMNDNFNTRVAIRELLSLINELNRHVDDRERYDYPGLQQALERVETLGGDVLGFTFESSPKTANLVTDLTELVLDIREEERADGRFERADDLREALASLGIVVEDSDSGPTYRFRP
jgi:cysteinyl-tRNA synthetase